MRTGLWIPVEIEDMPLSLTEKVLLAEIISLSRVGECFASNSHFAKILGVRPDSVSRIISKLKKMGLVKETGFDGRKRKLVPLTGLAASPTQPKAKPQFSIGIHAESAYAPKPKPITIVQRQYKVQKSWEGFLEWSRGKVSGTSLETILKLGDPNKLHGSNKRMWEMWNQVGQ